MLQMVLGMALLAAQDVPPLAGTLPPLPPPRSARPDDDRPRGRLFISPMGEPFRSPDPVRTWFDRADGNHDDAVTLPEFLADADRFFVLLDRGKDGEIDPEDIEFYETVLAPEIRTGGQTIGGGGPGGGKRGGRSGSGGGGGRRGGEGGGDRGGKAGQSAGGSPQRYGGVKRGAARFGFFDYPEPVTVADTSLNRGIDPIEFRTAAADRFALLDHNHDGKIARNELPRLSALPINARGPGGRGGKRPRPDGTAGPDGDSGADE